MYNRLHNETSTDKTSPNESKTETTDISAGQSPVSYGSTPVQDKAVRRFYVPFCGLIFYIMAFFGFFCSFSLREALSVAIVSMVNHTTISETDIAMTNVSDHDKCPRDPEVELKRGELNWDRNQVAIVLSAFFYGFLFTPLLGGFTADRFGGKWLYGGAVLLSSVVALLTPTVARIHIGLLIALRVLSGLGEGQMAPAVQALMARWSAPQHRTLVAVVIFFGSDVGSLAGLLLSGVLCDYGFAGGWPSAFYVFGMIGCVWSVAWFFLCYNSPQTHPRISTAELDYWERTIGSADLAGHPPTPWRKILTSLPVWALVLATFADGWTYFTLTTWLPLYMHDVLGFNMSKNGLFSALPFMAAIPMVPVCGRLADWLRSPGRLSTTVVRKSFCFVGFTLSGCLLIAVGFLGCNRALAVLTLIIATAGKIPAVTTINVNQLDLAPLHAGKITGLAVTIATLGSIASPMIVGALTQMRSTHAEWQKVFFLAAGVSGVAAIVYLIFGSGQRQSWAD